MGLFTKLGLRNGVGSVGETTRAILLPLMGVSINELKRTTKDNEFLSVLIHRRIMAASVTNTDLKSYLRSISVDEILSHFERFDEATNNKVKSDVAFMVLLIIYLESIRKREAFATASDSLLNDTLEVIYEESQKLCPIGIKFPKGDFIVKAKEVCSYLFRLYELLDQRY